MRETRVIRNVEMRATVDDTGQHFIDLKPLTIGVVDDLGSMWEPDTFNKYASQRLPVLCWSHDWSDPLGPGKSYTPGPDGPQVRFGFSDFDAVPSARRAFAQVQDGTIVDCSVGFSEAKRRDPTEEEIAKYPGVREVIFEAELDEVSLVLRGAVPGAKVLALRSANGKREVPEEFVIDLARKVKEGKITKEEAHVALDLVAEQGGPATPGDDGGGGDEAAQSEDSPPSAAETEADEALEAIEQV